MVTLGNIKCLSFLELLPISTEGINILIVNVKLLVVFESICVGSRKLVRGGVRKHTLGFAVMLQIHRAAGCCWSPHWVLAAKACQ
jgi:hypothetical protein